MRPDIFVIMLLLLAPHAMAQRAAPKIEGPAEIERGTHYSRPSDHAEELAARDWAPRRTAAELDLLAAASNGAAQWMLSLLGTGTNPRVRDVHGDGIVLLAVRSGSLSAVRVALASGADVDLAGRRGITPMIAAAIAGDVRMIEVLLRAGAGVDRRGGTGDTPLHMAAKLDRREAVELLLASGADALALDRIGRNLLGVAASSGAVRTAEFLLERGMDVHAVGRDYLTPIQWAIRFKRKSMVELLLAYGADPGVMSVDIFRDPLVELPPRRVPTTAPPPPPFRS